MRFEYRLGGGLKWEIPDYIIVEYASLDKEGLPIMEEEQWDTMLC